MHPLKLWTHELYSMPILIFLIALVLLVGYILINAYNRLVTLKNRYENAYAQIDVQLRRRYDLIPNLVEIAKGYMKHERETLEAVINARNAASQAGRRASQNPSDAQAIGNLENAEATLTGSLGRLFALSESYPDLKADQSMADLTEELRSTENRIAFARQAFNDGVTLYNTRTETFPSNLIAQQFNFRKAKLLEDQAPDEIQAAPKVSF